MEYRQMINTVNTASNTMPKRVCLLAALVLIVFAQRAIGQTAALQYVPVVTTYAGGATVATLCSSATDTLGDGCVATSSILAAPTTGDADAAGNIYVADSTNNVVRRIDATTGVITVVAGEVGSTAVCSSATDSIGDGCLATQAPLNNPRCVRIDRAGNLVIADVSNQVIRVVNKNTGIITLLMGAIGKTTHTPPKNTSPLTPLTTWLYNPYNFVFDSAGNMIVTNSTGDFLPIALAINGLIDPVNSKVYDLAGTGSASASPSSNGNGGLASAATFTTPRGLALDAAENVYVGDYGNQQARVISSPLVNGQVTAAGIIAATVNNFAGTGTSGTSGDGGQAILANVAAPQGVGLDNAGNVYIEQYGSGNDFIRIVNPATGIINTYAGTGAASFGGDGGPAISAKFTTPTALKFNLGNRMTVYDQSNNRLRNIYPTPFFSALAVGQSASQNAAIQAVVAATPASANSSNPEFSVGTASGCSLSNTMAAGAFCTFPIAFTPSAPGLRTGQLHIADSTGNVYNDSLQGVGLAPATAFYGALVATIAGNGTAGSSGNSGPASAALVNAPRGGAFDSAGNFYFADSGNHVVREIAKATGSVTIVAGTGSPGFAGDGSAATSAKLNTPTAVAVDPAGNIYIADSGNNRIRFVSSNTGAITTVAGTGVAGYTGDTGVATAATLNQPTGLAIDNAGTLYVADTGNNALRAFSPPNGVIVTLVGTGTAGYSGDGGIPQNAQLNAPTAVIVDLSGNIYVADTGNSVVRKIVPVVFGIVPFQGTISTFAGTAGTSANTGDGGAATAAALLTPAGVGVDAAGNLYIACGGQVRMVNSSGIIATIAGTGASGLYSGDGGGATAAVFPAPIQNITVDQVGNIYASDTGGNRIVAVSGSSAATLSFGSQTKATSSTAQSVTLYNSGNQALSVTNIAVPSGFSLSNTSTNSCGGTTVLVPGSTCVLSVIFTPTASVPYVGQIVITDNALNNAASTQSIPLAGTGVDHLDPTTTVLTYSPTLPTYGQTVTLTATVTGVSNPSGIVNFVINTATTVPVPLANGQASYSLSGLVVSSNSVTANYLGDTANAASSASTTFNVSPAVLTVTANNASKYPTGALPVFTYSITGFVNNDTATNAVTGSPVLSTTATAASGVGSYPITVAQGTLAAKNYIFTLVPGTLTVLSPTFSLSISPTSITIPSGQVGVVTAFLTATAGYQGTINLSCGPLPTNVVCSFNTSTVGLDASGPVSIPLTISTNNYSEIATTATQMDRTRLERTALILVLPLWSVGGFIGTRRRKRRLFHLLLAVIAGSTVLGLGGCAPGTRNAGQFNGQITITAIDTKANISQKATLGLVIK